MDLKKDNVGVIAGIAVILVATVAVFVFLFVKKVETPVIQSDVTKPITAPVIQTQSDSSNALNNPVSTDQNADTIRTGERMWASLKMACPMARVR